MGKLLPSKYLRTVILQTSRKQKNEFGFIELLSSASAVQDICNHNENTVTSPSKPFIFSSLDMEWVIITRDHDSVRE